MKHAKTNFIDYAFLLLRKLDHVNTILRGSFASFASAADVFNIKNEANILSASQFAWVLGGGSQQRIFAVSSVINPSPLTHENIQWRYSRGY